MSTTDSLPEDDDVEMIDVSADDLLDNALIDYVETLEDADKTVVMQRLENEEAFYAAMSKALNEMAMLIAAAAVLDDEQDFNKRRKLVLFEARGDAPEVQALRLHYLNHRNEVDMERLLYEDDKKARFDKRLSTFLNDYKQSHGL